jgi:WD40 repeat protein
MRRRENVILLTALAPFFVYPLATVRTDDRFILPYIPILILLAVFAVDSRDLRNKTLRLAAIGALLVTLVALPVVNRAQVLDPEEPNLMVTKIAGLAFRPQVKPDDNIADRKPFFAYYAGGKYVQIPVAPYGNLMNYLVEKNVKYISLHQPTIHNLRPVLRPLLYDYLTINGELRYRQAHFDPAGVIVYTRERDTDPLEWARLTRSSGGSAVNPAWSPDGRKIAFRSRAATEVGGIYVIPLGESPSRRGVPQKIVEAPLIDDQLSFSPDASHVAYASKTGSETNIYTVELATGNIKRIPLGGGNNLSPSWSPNGKEVVFSSDRTGRKEIWMVNLDTGDLSQLTGDGNNTRPVFSPSGDKLAWIKKGRGLVIFHRQHAKMLQLRPPTKVEFAPTWSPNERYIAVTAEDWGSWDVYLLKSNGSGALLLTKNKPGRDVMPAWSPDGRRLAVVSDRGEKTMSIWTVENLDLYFERLENPSAIQTFKQPSVPSE